MKKVSKRQRQEIIEGHGLTYEYLHYDEEGRVDSTFQALKGVDLEVEAGQFIAILGHNGSGKSTLARQLNALLVPTGGTLFVDGCDTRDESKVWQIRQAAGMVFQNPDNQFISSVVEEDVGFGPENMGVPTKEIWSRVRSALEAVGMWDQRKRSPNRLSGGQKQRVAIAGVIAMKPKCIVLDEPTAMLDPGGRAEVVGTALKLNREEGITVILITHYMEEVVHADRVLVMDQGQVVMKGRPEEIFSRVEDLKRIRLDVPQVTELAYLLQKDGVPLPEGILTAEDLADALDKIKPEGAAAGAGESHMAEKTGGCCVSKKEEGAEDAAVSRKAGRTGGCCVSKKEEGVEDAAVSCEAEKADGDGEGKQEGSGK